jgi:hypothetical protein
VRLLGPGSDSCHHHARHHALKAIGDSSAANRTAIAAAGASANVLHKTDVGPHFLLFQHQLSTNGYPSLTDIDRPAAQVPPELTGYEFVFSVQGLRCLNRLLREMEKLVIDCCRANMWAELLSSLLSIASHAQRASTA